MAEAASAAEVPPLHRGLPDEIVIWEILVLLPPKSLLGCRTFSPAWRCATSSRDFLLAHHARQPTLPLVYAYHGNARGSIIDIIPFNHRTGVAAADQLQSVARLGHVIFDMEASCDGLLVLSINEGHFCICNPATRQYAPLPILRRHFLLLGMYPHSPTGEYRLLLNKQTHWMHDEGPPTTEYACHVFTIGSGQPPRRIECPDARKMILTTNALFSRVSVLLHGSVHWHNWYNGQIMAFDTTAESFWQIHPPIFSNNAGLFEIGGMLGLSSLNDGETIMDIWVMQDYEDKVWAFKHRVALPVAQFGKFYNQIGVAVPSGNGDVLVLLRVDEWLLQIDTNVKLLASFHRNGLCPSDVMLKQTLVPYTFFPALEGYVVKALPFI